jgi:hypothetical protein
MTKFYVHLVGDYLLPPKYAKSPSCTLHLILTGKQISNEQISDTASGPLRVIINLSPMGNAYPFIHPRGEHSLLFSRMEGRTVNFTPRG